MSDRLCQRNHHHKHHHKHPQYNLESRTYMKSNVKAIVQSILRLGRRIQRSFILIGQPLGQIFPNRQYRLSAVLFGLSFLMALGFSLTNQPNPAYAAAAVSKVFAPNVVNPGEKSRATITITNNNNFDLTNAGITDAMPSAIKIYNPASATTTCGAGIVTATPGGSTVTLSSGTVPATVGATTGTCTISFDVYSNASGTTQNSNIPAGSLTNTQNDTNGNLDVTLTIRPITYSSVTGSKSFAPASFAATGSSTATITLTNPNAVAMDGATLIDDLNLVGAGLTVQGSPSSTCLGTNGTVSNTATTVTLNNGRIPANSSCTITFSVTGTIPATYTNRIPANALSTFQGATNNAQFEQNVTITEPVSLAKSFSVSPIKQGDISRATVTITNNSTSQLTNLTVPDNLASPGSGLLYRSDLAPSTTCTGGSVAVTGASGTAATITLQNATLNAGASCAFSFDVTSNSLGNRTNTVLATAVNNNLALRPVNNGTATLVVNPLLTINKSYSATVPSSNTTVSVGETTNLFIDITNPPTSNVDPVNITSMTDAFNTSGRVVLVTTGVGAGTSSCGGTITGTSSNAFTFSGGAIARGATCRLTIPIRGSTSGSTTNDIPANNITSTQGVSNVASNTPTITVNSPFTVQKVYGTPAPRQGDPTLLTITLRNRSTLPATNVSLTDTLDSRLRIVSPATPGLITTGVVTAPATTCGGILTAPLNTGGPTISLTGGTIPAGTASTPTSCTITFYVQTDVLPVDATVPPLATAGTYRNTIPLATTTADYGSGPSPAVVESANSNRADLTPTGALDISNKQVANSPYTTFVGNVTTNINTPIAVRITLRNRSANLNLAGLNLTDSFPTAANGGGFVLYRPGAAPFEPSTTCNYLSTPVFTGTNGGTSLAMASGGLQSAASIGGNRTCTITFYVIATQEGGTTGTAYNNTLPIGSVKATNTSVVTGQADNIYSTDTAPDTASATANSPLTIGKAFSVASTSINTNATATITLTNNYAAIAVAPNANSLTNLGFTDTLPANLRAVAGTTGGTCVTARGGTADIIKDVALNQDRVTLTGTTLPQGQSCTVTFTVTSSNVAAFTNTINRSTEVTNAQSLPAQANATANISFIAGLSVTKTFDNLASQTILAGQTSVLRIAINNTSGQNLAAVSLDDNLPANVLIASPANASATAACGSPTLTADPNTNLVRITNASINNTQTCTVAVTVISSVTSTGYVNTIPANAVNTGVGVTNTSPATATLIVTSPLSITKSFNSSTIGGNGTSTVTLTIANRFPGVVDFTSTPVGLTDTWAAANIQIANPPNASTTCAGGTVNAIAGQKTVTLSGGQILAGSVTTPSTCLVQFDVVATAATPTPFTNTIPANNLSTVQGFTNSTAATANLTITSYNLIVGKSFNPSTVDGGTPTVLKIDIENPSTGIPLTNLRFVDNMPAGMIVYSVPNPIVSANCPGGVVSATPGAGSFSFSGGSLAPNQTCTITLNVTSVQQGTLTNSIPPSNFGTNQGILTKEGIGYPSTVAANFSVLPSAEFSKEFDLPSIPPGGVSTLKISVANTAISVNLTGMNFQDNLPTGLIVAPIPNIQNNGCNGTITANAGSSLIQLAGGSLLASSSCSIQVDVTAASSGIYNNTIPSGNLQTTQNITNKQPATTLFPVQPQPNIAKIFNPSTSPVGGTSQMTITITNPHTAGLVNVNLDDNLPANLVIAPTAGATTTCGGSLTAVSNTSLVRLTNGSITANNSCTIQVNVTSGVGGSYTNTIPARALTSSVVNGANPPIPGPSNANPASATLVFGTTSISKSFAPTTISQNGISTLTLQLNNNTGVTLTLTSALVDTLPSNVLVAATPNIGGTCTTANVVANANGNTITYNNGSTIPNGGCTISVQVTSATNGVYVNTIPANGLQTTGGNNPSSATASLTVQGGAPNVVLVKRITRINGNDFNVYENDPLTTNDDNTNNWPTPLSDSLRGVISQTNVRPQDEVEYTIYYLNIGLNYAESLRICDPVPTNTSYIANAFNGSTPTDGGLPADLGIALQTGTTVADRRFLTGINDGDRGRYYDPLLSEVPAGLPPERCVDPNNTSVAISSNPNGIVAVNVTRTTGTPTFPSVPNATGAGVPPSSYGFVRFRVRVR